MHIAPAAPMPDEPGPAPTGPAVAGKVRFGRGQGGAFYRAIRNRVGAHIAATGGSAYANAGLWLKGSAYFGIVLASYVAILCGGFGPWGLLALANLFGVGTLLLAINMGHDAAHGTLARPRWVNQVVLYVSFALIGADPYLWQQRHIHSHHVFPNVNGCDIDIDNNLLLRLSPNHRRRWYQRYQHWYAPVVFWLVDIHTVFIQDFHYLFKRQLANMTDIVHPWHAYLGFIACKAAFLTIVLGIPALVLPMPWWEVLIGTLLMSFVSSSLFVYLLIGTHFAEETIFPAVGNDGRLPYDWPTHAMLTSLDWSPYSRFALAIAGGSNAHAAHHLFPNISHAHYRAITRIIAEEAAARGIPHHVTNFPRMVRSHFRFLRSLGQA